jgi:hypothetical protein
MTFDVQGMQLVGDQELSSVHGGKKKIWGWVKNAAKWAKDHVVIGAKSIGIKGKF